MIGQSHVKVFTLSGPDCALHYSVPPGMHVPAGALVWVPLQGRKTVGIVLELGDTELPYALKPLVSLVYPEALLTADLLKLIAWMKAYYGTSVESLCQTFLPAVVRKGLAIKSELYVEANLQLDEGLLEKSRKRAPQQVALYEWLRDNNSPVSKKALLETQRTSPAVLEGLLKKGWILKTHKRIERRLAITTPGGTGSPQAPVLNAEQAAALATIETTLGGFQTLLLHGVTGSGKTEVYMQAIEKALQGGGQALYLVPELSLTPQVFGRLRERFLKKTVALWHHQLSDGERFDTYQAASRGAIDIILGARSAVFVPLPDLKLIIVDEEHEPSYKQEESPRYHGRNVAIYRAKCQKIPCILGSATPSTESFLNAEQGRYTYCQLTQRAAAQSLPRLQLVDMGLELSKTGALKGPLSRLLLDKLQDRLDLGQQSLLFINKRGYSRVCLCPQCHFKALCPGCALPLTYHRHDARLRCHLCQYDQAALTQCPQCRSPKIQWKGLGTERLEAVLARCFPQARIVRVDADTMAAKDSIGRCLSALARGEIDILVGTQLLAKGLDFPKVTLVGLIDADMAFNMPDFRARERGFQLLMQVSGRAGRAADAGEVIIQTFDPKNPLFTWARQGDTVGFLKDELAQRKELGYPPYRRLIRHLFTGPDVQALAHWTQQWAQLLEQHTPSLPPLEILGPAPAALEKCNHQYRYHFWYFSSSILTLLPQLLSLRKNFPLPKELSDRFDVDPVHLM